MKPCGTNLFHQICIFVILTLYIPGLALAATPRIDLRDLAIFAQFWLADDCSVSNYGCYGADLDHWNDRDYDGYFSNGLDCDDLNPNAYPGAPEFFDGVDNDCNGIADEGWIGPGDIIITEILYDSSDSPDEAYEWFEVYNPHLDHPINMRGWIIRDQPGSMQEIAVINDDVIVPPGGYAVLCRTLSAAHNGGVECDYEYGFLQLTNTADELILEFEGVIVDEVWYDETGGWPRATSGSLSLDPDALFLDNNDPMNWCDSPIGPDIPNGDEATPGYENVDCP